MRVVVQLKGQDQIEAEKQSSGQWKISAFGCHDFLLAISTLHKAFGSPEVWPLPEGVGHVDLLMREFILKTRGEWKFPDQDQEICHCRIVSTAAVDHAIVNGAHQTHQVSRVTSASTACGTCRPDVQRLIDYRLQGTQAVNLKGSQSTQKKVA